MIFLWILAVNKSAAANNSSSSGIGSGRGRAASLPTKPGYGVRTSVSNQSLKSACSDQASTRWHSNSSLNSAPPIKKETTSKIASLWKRVDENKKKQQQGKDTRVWIPPEPKSKQVSICDLPLWKQNCWQFITKIVRIILIKELWKLGPPSDITSTTYWNNSFSRQTAVLRIR